MWWPVDGALSNVCLPELTAAGQTAGPPPRRVPPDGGTQGLGQSWSQSPRRPLAGVPAGSSSHGWAGRVPVPAHRFLAHHLGAHGKRAFCLRSCTPQCAIQVLPGTQSGRRPAPGASLMERILLTGPPPTHDPPWPQCCPHCRVRGDNHVVLCQPVCAVLPISAHEGPHGAGLCRDRAWSVLAVSWAAKAAATGGALESQLPGVVLLGNPAIRTVENRICVI